MTLDSSNIAFCKVKSLFNATNIVACFASKDSYILQIEILDHMFKELTPKNNRNWRLYIVGEKLFYIKFEKKVTQLFNVLTNCD